MFKRLADRIDIEIEKDGLLHHYKLMLFFLFYRFEGISRFEGKKYYTMRHYFARRLVTLLKRFTSGDWSAKTLLDVGGATGDFCSYISKRTGARCVNIDPDPGKIFRANFHPSLQASGAAIALADKSCDIVISRGVIEHVPLELHEEFVRECFRVLRPGGVGYLTSSPWFAPWAGHQLAPFHVFPIRTACLLTNLFYGTSYNYRSYAQADLYYLSFDGFAKTLRRAGFEIKYVEDPITRLDFLTKIPVLREALVQHMAFVVTRPLT